MRRLLLLPLIVAACDDPLRSDPVAELSVETLTVEDCGPLDGFARTLDTDGVDDCGGVTFIRLQRGGRPIGESDGIVVELEDADGLRDAIAADGAAEVVLPAPGVRCSLYLFRRCPASNQPLACGAGTLHAESLEPHGRVRFTLQADVVDLRTGVIAGTGLALDADFRVSKGTPHRPFSGCPED